MFTIEAGAGDGAPLAVPGTAAMAAMAMTRRCRNCRLFVSWDLLNEKKSLGRGDRRIPTRVVERDGPLVGEPIG